MTHIQDTENAHSSGAYAKRPLTLVSGQGCYATDDEGNRYLDLTSGMGVALLGHAHPVITEAIYQQAGTLITCPEAFYNDRRAELYTELSNVLPSELTRFFLCNSGTEAMEGALKIARLLTGRTGIISVKRGFHGRTLGALATTWNPQYREPFVGWTPPDVRYISQNDIAGAQATVDESVAAVVVESVQGEGGVYPANAEWLQALYALCEERGALLIIDEVQSGLGRTGAWFGFQHAGIVPHMVTLGKGIAGGVPMGAVAWRGSLGTIGSGTHGSTFGGNPLACASAIATLRQLQALHAPEHTREVGAWFLDALRGLALPSVREVRGLGFMIGLEMKVRVTPLLQALQAQGILALPAGKTVLRFLPPLITTQAQLQGVLELLPSIFEGALTAEGR